MEGWAGMVIIWDCLWINQNITNIFLGMQTLSKAESLHMSLKTFLDSSKSSPYGTHVGVTYKLGFASPSAHLTCTCLFRILGPVIGVAVS